MPRVAIDYSKTVIYRFVCKDTNVKSEYVGSTTNFNKRKGGHKTNCCYETKHHHYKLYQTIRENGGWDNWDMVPLEEFSCENKTQQLIREQYWIDRLKPELNSYVAYREGTTLKEKKKACYDARVEKNKAYREANSVVINEKKKAYREANSVMLKEKRSIKHTCECGVVYYFYAKSKHEKTQKHKDFIMVLNI